MRKILILLILLIIIATYIVFKISKIPKPLTQPQINELYRVMAQADKILSMHGIEYSISCGTLLGAVRNRGLIPWDNDIDLIIAEKDQEKIINLKNVFDQNCIDVVYKDHIWRLSSKNMSNVYIDLFPYTEISPGKFDHTDKHNRSRFSKEYLYYDDLFPIKREYQFGPLLLPGPNQGIKFLERMYGKKWMVPKGRLFFSDVSKKGAALPERWENEGVQ